MKTKQEKIDEIYEKIARKDFTFWCILRRENHRWDVLNYKIIDLENKIFDTIKYWLKRKIELKIFYDVHNTGDISIILNSDEINKDISETFNNVIWNWKIIWHPVMIWDVLDYFWEKEWAMTLDEILRVWEKKKFPIEDQSDNCIDYVYNLIK